MKAKISEAQQWALDNPSADLEDNPYMKQPAKEKEMGKALLGDLTIFDGKKVSNLKDNIQMTIVDNKLSVLNIVFFDLVESDAEVKEQSFFAGADSKEDVVKCELHFLVDPSDGVVFQNPSRPWTKGKVNANLETLPEEMVEIISKSIELNKGIAKNFEKDDVNRFAVDEFSVSEFIPSIDMTKMAYDELMTEIQKHKASNGSVNIEDFIDRYYFKKHILIQGEKGGGKTYLVDKKIRTEGVDSELIIGHEGIEAIDLLGYYVKTDTGDLVWLDGALTKSFRKAIDNEVCLFIDEMLRIPKRELNILVGSLTPSSVGTYRLRTNRVINIADGIGETEVIEIPMANLWCVGTTNVGAGYEVDDIDDALADRFRTVNKLTSNSELESILNTYITGSLTVDVVPKLIDFYSQIRDLMVSGELERVVNTRHLCEVLTLSEDDSEIKSYMFDLIPTWTSMDTNGQPNKAERDIITKLIKKIMK